MRETKKAKKKPRAPKAKKPAEKTPKISDAPVEDPALNPPPADPPEPGRAEKRQDIMDRAEGRGKPRAAGEEEPKKRGRKKKEKDDGWNEQREAAALAIPPDDLQKKWQSVADVMTAISAGLISIFFREPEDEMTGAEMDLLSDSWTTYLCTRPPENYVEYAEYVLMLAYVSIVAPRALRKGFILYERWKTTRKETQDEQTGN